MRRQIQVLRYGFLLIITVLAWGSFTTHASAQCARGAPPLPNGKCPPPAASKPASSSPSSLKRRPRPEPRATAFCSISMEVSRKDGVKTSNVELIINGKRKGAQRTDQTGRLVVNGLACEQRYDLRPVKSAVRFDPPTMAIPSLKGQARIVFLELSSEKIEPKAAPVEAELEPTAPPPATAAPPPCNPPSGALQNIALGESVAGVISPQVSGCDPKSGAAYYNDYMLKGVSGGDMLSLELRSPQLNELDVQILDLDSQALKPGDVIEKGDLQAIMIVLPESTGGDPPFRLRARSAGQNRIEYTLSVVRKGLTPKAYDVQFRQVISAMAPPGVTTFYEALNYNLTRLREDTDWKTRDAAEKRMKKATELLESLAQVVPENPQPHEMLSAIYLYQTRAPMAAITQRELSIQYKGGVGFRVKIGDSFVSNKQGEKIVSRDEECWLLIQEGRVSCESFNRDNGEIFKSPSPGMDKTKLIFRKSDMTLKIAGTRRYARRNRKKELTEEVSDREIFLAPLSGNKDESTAIQEAIVRLVVRKNPAR